MKKITQATIALLMVLFLSIGSATLAQNAGDGGQGGGDTGGPNCAPPRVCKPVNPESSATTALSQVGTVAPDGQTTDGIFFDLLLLFIRFKLIV